MLDPAALSNIILISTTLAGAFLSALWLSLIIWTYRDIRKRSRDLMTRALSILVSIFLFIPGIIIYLILRPTQTIEEEYQHAVEEEALLQTIEDKPTCPGCGRKVDADWLVCPGCYTKLRKNCHQCGKILDLGWNLCPWCETPIPGTRIESLEINRTSENYQTDLTSKPD